MIRDIVHVNLNVADIERSIRFYEQIGFRIMHVFGDTPGADVRDGMAFDDGRCRGVVMTLGEHPRAWTKLELIEWLDPPAEIAPPRGPRTTGVSRIALRTKNLLEHVAALEAAGIDFESPPREIDIVGATRFALFRDPDGVLLELIEF